jgi:drug/metabolite transporter (DMT)-like permease
MNALSTPERADTRPLAGVLWMVLTGLLFVGMTAIVKNMGDAVPAAQAAFLRYLLGLVFLLPMLPAMMRARLGRRDLGLFGLRGAVHTLGVILWFFAMTRIPLAEVTAMNYLVPVYVTLGAALFLGERLRLRRILAVGAAILGAMIILRPGLREVSPGHIAMLGTAVFMSASYLIAKRMTGSASPEVVVGMLSVTVTIGLAPFAWVVWVPVTTEQLGWFLLVAFFATAGHYTMTLAFTAAPIGVTQPVTALQLVWAVALGALAFGEPIDPYVVTGGVVIVSAVIFIALREQAMRRARLRDDGPPTIPREGV